MDLIGPYNRYAREVKTNIQLKPFLLNPPDQTVYVTGHKAMTTTNLVDIFRMTAYNHSQVPSFSIYIIKFHMI